MSPWFCWIAFFSFAFSAFSSLPALADWRLSCLAVNCVRQRVLVGAVVERMAGVEGWDRHLQVEESLFET
jgi:hypothetical protein